MEINNEQLIAEVQKFPCLYNIDHEEYRNKELKNSCWVAVTRRILGNGRWEESSGLEIECLSRAVQKRWKNLRDAFTRALKCQIARGASKPYIYEKQLSFLLPEPASQKRLLVIKDEPEENLVICEPDVNTSHLDDSQDSNVKHHPSVSDSEMTSSPSFTRHKVRDHDQDQDYNLYFVDSNSDEQTDDDTMFLMSLVPSFRQIPPSAKLDARIKILEALKPFIPYHK